MTLQSIGRYNITAELGKGAMGVVYKATDPNIGRTVAIKTTRLDAHGLDAQELLRRFKNEARSAGTLNHPNIVTIYDAGEQDGIFYLRWSTSRARPCTSCSASIASCRWRR